MDMLVESAADYQVVLKDRLDAQGVIWCLYELEESSGAR